MRTERDIQNDILVAVSSLPQCMVWRANSGVGVTPQGRPLRCNVPGCADIIGVYRGRGIGIEVNTPIGRQSETQRNFQRAWQAAGGLYIVAHSAEDAMRQIRDCTVP